MSELTPGESNRASDLPSLFDVEQELPAAGNIRPAMMTDTQRASLRVLFSALEVSQASAQFDMVYQLTGQRITSVTQLQARHAHLLVQRLEQRISDVGRTGTGNTWADREEDTWIDKL